MTYTARWARAPLPFLDVTPGDWYYDSVRYVYFGGLMKGVSDTRFAPQGTTSRAMIVTILYRLEQEPAAGGSSFRDVKQTDYFADAVAWAAANGIVEGYGNGCFGPHDPVTRQQLAVILYRYAAFKGLDVSGSADLSGFVDGAQVSRYARPAVAWAVRTGILTGRAGRRLDPDGLATRAQTAAMLMRLLKN